MVEDVLHCFATYVYLLSILDADKLTGLDNEAQNLVNCLQVLEVLTPAVHVELLSKVILYSVHLA